MITVNRFEYKLRLAVCGLNNGKNEAENPIESGKSISLLLWMYFFSFGKIDRRQFKWILALGMWLYLISMFTVGGNSAQNGAKLNLIRNQITLDAKNVINAYSPQKASNSYLNGRKSPSWNKNIKTCRFHFYTKIFKGFFGGSDCWLNNCFFYFILIKNGWQTVCFSMLFEPQDLTKLCTVISVVREKSRAMQRKIIYNNVNHSTLKLIFFPLPEGYRSSTIRILSSNRIQFIFLLPNLFQFIKFTHSIP